jgi:hypothetical protein
MMTCACRCRYTLYLLLMKTQIYVNYMTIATAVSNNVHVKCFKNVS